jgi:hypothetical protein
MMRVCVALALPGRQQVIPVDLEDGATVADALRAAKASEFFAGLEPSRLRAGIWGKACPMNAPLRDGDRVEIYRALQADPKEMRRARAGLRSSRRSRSGP